MIEHWKYGFHPWNATLCKYRLLSYEEMQEDPDADHLVYEIIHDPTGQYEPGDKFDGRAVYHDFSSGPNDGGEYWKRLPLEATGNGATPTEARKWAYKSLEALKFSVVQSSKTFFLDGPYESEVVYTDTVEERSWQGETYGYVVNYSIEVSLKGWTCLESLPTT